MKKIVPFAIAGVLVASALTVDARQGGGGGGGSTETIRVSKCEYAPLTGYIEMLIKASSSNTSAHLYAYLPTGAYLGEVQNGSGGRYGGTVFVTYYPIPQYITIVSSAGARINAPTTLYQP